MCIRISECMRRILGLVRSIRTRLSSSPSPRPNLRTRLRLRIRSRIRIHVRFMCSQSCIVSLNVRIRMRSASMMCIRNRLVIRFAVAIIMKHLFVLSIGVISAACKHSSIHNRNTLTSVHRNRLINHDV